MRTSLREHLRALPGPAWVLFAGTFINRFGTFVTPFLVLYFTKQGFSVATAGLAASAYGGGHLAASTIGGHLADRIGRRNTIAASMFGSAIAMLTLSQVRGLPLMMLCTFIAGMFAELYRPASHALLTDLVPQEHRVIAFGVYRFAVNLGFATGPALAGFLADRAYVYLFVGDAVTSVGYGLVALFALPHGRTSRAKDEQPGGAASMALRDRRFVFMLLATLLYALIDFQMGSTFALHVTSLGYPSKVYGMLISLNGLMIVLFELALTQWVQRFDPQRVIAIGYLLNGIGFALTGIALNAPALAMTVVVWTLGEMISSPVSAGYVAQLAPEQYRGRYMGMLMLVWSIGMLLGPAVGTFVFERDPRMVWIACGVLGVASSLLALARPRTITAA